MITPCLSQSGKSPSGARGGMPTFSAARCLTGETHVRRSPENPERLIPFTILVSAVCLGSVLGPTDRLLAQTLPPECSTTGISGVLRVSSVNPRYFTNDCGKAIYLTGSHTWNNFPDMDDNYPPENAPFDYAHYLDFLDQYNQNFIRLWAWEGPFPDDAVSYPRRVWAGPQPWLRTGPGNDYSGHPKFDLTQWNQAYFDRLRQRVSQAQARGKYVSILLFEGWELRYAAGMYSHPFNGLNNINGIGVGSAMTDIHTLTIPAITAIQEEYVRRVIDSVNDLDNVLYEICNEPSATYATAWQYHMIQYVKQYEATKPKQHPVGMSYQADGVNSDLFNSGADWVSPGLEGNYLADPPANDGSKVVINDTDHLGGSSVGDRSWVWKSFMRGLNTLFMDEYDLPWSIGNGPIPNASEIRQAMGNTLTFSRRMDLLHTTPSGALSSTGYALANASECLVYSPSSSSFSVNLQSYVGQLQVEWFSPVTQQTTLGGIVTGGTTSTFQPPFSDDAVLYLPALADSVPSSPEFGGFALHVPAPNPAIPVSHISYDVPVATKVRIEVYDLSGRRVAVLLDRIAPPGRWEVTWDGTGINGGRVASGVYFVRMTAGEYTFSKKLVIRR
jgi:hypothetical protein